MDFEKLSKEERFDVLTEMADMFYNRGMTQIEIAQKFHTTRFKVAKLIQDARNEKIVEIRINYSTERNKSMEKELMRVYPLRKVLVVNTENSPYLDGLRQIGKVCADYLMRLLVPRSVLGLTWGKTIQTVVGQLPQIAHNPVFAVQLTGYFPLPNPASESHSLVQAVSSAFFGRAYFLNTPLYMNNLRLRSELMAEPDVLSTLVKAKEMDVVLTGIGGYSSLPLSNPALKAYLTAKDIAAASRCIGSIYGYVLDKEGKIADVDLNGKLVAVPLEDILHTAHRIGVAYGRHKVEITAKAIQNGYVNELVTDTQTAMHLLDPSFIETAAH